MTNIGSTTRLYGSSIAVVSGVYALASSLVAVMGSPTTMDADGLGIGGWIMIVVGIVVLVHGILLLTPAIARLRRASGPLMILWAAVMLLNQAALAAVPGWGMPGSQMGGSPMTAGMAWDAGMVAIAVIMLASGIIMSSRRT
jgi:hypothetical protein